MIYLAVGYWRDTEDIKQEESKGRIFSPNMEITNAIGFLKDGRKLENALLHGQKIKCRKMILDCTKYTGPCSSVGNTN